MISSETAKLLEIVLVCLWIGASLGGFALLWLGGRRGLLAFLRAELFVQSVAGGVLGCILLVPMVLGQEQAVDPDEKAKVEFPPLDTSSWSALVVQHDGRNKPFESAATEILRSITGRSKYQNHDAVSVVLQWMVLRGEGLDGNPNTWEREPFILCPDGDLRELIYRDLLGEDATLTDEHRRGKYISPQELRKSDALLQLVVSVRNKRMEDSEKWQQLLTPLERKAHEVEQRLRTFDEVSQNNPMTFGKLESRQKPEDPIGLVGFDRRGGGWLSLGQLRKLKAEDDPNRSVLERSLVDPVGIPLPGSSPDFVLFDSLARIGLAATTAEQLQRHSEWREIMKDRLSRVPQLYLSPRHLDVLHQFQAQVKAGTAQRALDDLAGDLQKRREQQVQEIVAAWSEGEGGPLINFVQKHELNLDDKFRVLRAREFGRMSESERGRERLFIYLTAFLEINRRSDDSKRQLALRLLEDYKTPDKLPTLGQQIDTLLAERDEAVIRDLERRVAAARKDYHPDDPRYSMLHLSYLESRFPNIYIESAAWQTYPREDVNRVLASFEAVQQAYRSADPATFEKASQDFFATVGEVSEKYDVVNGYPGITTAGLEMQLNRVRPFMWGWISMLGCIAFLVASLTAGKFGCDGTGRLLYGLGSLFYLTSLAFQIFGFIARIVIAGRPPVSNMYETIIFAGGMAAVFAVFLELRYRSTLILLSGSVASCIALVLADQLPNVQGIESNIRPLVPVLRTNWWLIIHVLTIVSSYAGGALAWVIGNIVLGLISFGNPPRETIKTLSQFSYRAMQIAVLLLAAGTFLGGWWAVESWGRFWGWDPKEVWALISLVCYVIPLHARYAGWVKDFGLAVSAVLCFAAIMFSWYGVNFVLGAGLHSYGFGGGGPWWVAWVAMLNLVYVLACCLTYLRRTAPQVTVA
jgi:ABC-type transport system involved in cytochrome c biogenesis permease subunit